MSYSTLGRPRKLTDEQVAAVMFWSRLPKRARPSSVQLAASLGVAETTIRKCVARGGRYKKACPTYNPPVDVSGNEA